MRHHRFNPRPYGRPSLLTPLLGLLLLALSTHAADQLQWGQAWSRNMVSAERGLPNSFDPKTGQHVKWKARLGTETHSTPVVANGRVYIGTNNGEPRDPKHQGDRGVLMCFDETTGQLLWQLVVPKREDDPYLDWPKCGISSPVSVDGDRVYLVNNRGEVMCLDAKGLADGNDGPFRDEGSHMALRGTPPLTPGQTDADVLWVFDLTKEAGIWSHDAAHSSILIDGAYLYLNSGTGVDNTHRKIRAPDAPSLVVLDKSAGRYVARDDEQIGPRIFHCTWSSPSLGEAGGRRAIFFAGGDGVIYSFEALAQPTSSEPPTASSPEPAKLKRLWRFDFDPAAPKEDVHRYNSNRRESPSNIYGMPVFDNNRLYVAGGGDLFWGKREAWIKCIDATKTGDITTNGLVWSLPLQRHTISTPAIWNGLLFIADCGRTVHCLDPATGHTYWTHETQNEMWASPLVADGKVYIGTRRGDFWILNASRDKRVLSKVELGAPISATATAASSVLYVATMTDLYALAE